MSSEKVDQSVFIFKNISDSPCQTFKHGVYTILFPGAHSCVF